MKRIHRNMSNPDYKAWHMGVDRTRDITERNNAVVFQEGVLDTFQHFTAGAWALPVASYKRVGDGIVLRRPFPNLFTIYWRELIVHLVSRHPSVYSMFSRGKVIEVSSITGGLLIMHSSGVSM